MFSDFTVGFLVGAVAGAGFVVVAVLAWELIDVLRERALPAEPAGRIRLVGDETPPHTGSSARRMP